MSKPKTYIGVDLHKKTCYVTVMNGEGKIRIQREISTNESDVSRFFKRYADVPVAVESTMNWIPFYENLESLGCKVSLSNPLATKAIAHARIKNDKVDSRILAELLRTNLLPTAYIQPRHIRDLKEIVRERANFVEMRTKIKNKIHSVLFKTNNRHSFTNLYGKMGMKWLSNLKLREIYRTELDRYLETLEHLNEQIGKISDIIESRAKLDFDCKLLMTIPGVSYYSALMIKSEIGDISRFKNANKLCSYAGLIPSTYTSADKIRTGRITKRGSKWLRKTIIDAVTSGSRNHNRIAAFYKKLKKNKGTGKAKVAAGRKLCSIIYAMLTDQVPFQDFAPTKQR